MRRNVSLILQKAQEATKSATEMACDVSALLGFFNGQGRKIRFVNCPIKILTTHTQWQRISSALLVLRIQVDLKNYFLKRILALPWILSTHLHREMRWPLSKAAQLLFILSSA